MATAEELFATRGIDAVSVRDITEAADANTASINYHFGSKRGLIDAIVERRAEALGRRRVELLDELEGGEPVDARGDAGDGAADRRACTTTHRALYVSFLAALGDHPELMPALDAFEPSTERYLQGAGARDAGAAGEGAGVAVRRRSECGESRPRPDVGRAPLGSTTGHRGGRPGGERDRHARGDLHRACLDRSAVELEQRRSRCRRRTLRSSSSSSIGERVDGVERVRPRRVLVRVVGLERDAGRRR